MRRRFVLFILCIILVLSVVYVFLLINQKPDEIKILPELKISKITQSEFFSYAKSYNLTNQLASYMNWPNEEYANYQFLKIDRAEICKDYKVPVQYGALLIVKHSQIERVIPFVDNSSFKSGFIKYDFEMTGIHCNVESDNTLYIGLGIVVAKNTPAIERSEEYYWFRWQAPNGMTFNDDSTQIILP